MKLFKESQYETKREKQKEKLEKRENSVLLTKSLTNQSFSRYTDNFNYKNRIYQHTEVILN